MATASRIEYGNAYHDGYQAAMQDILSVIRNCMGDEDNVTTIYDERETLASVREFVETGLGIR